MKLQFILTLFILLTCSLSFAQAEEMNAQNTASPMEINKPLYKPLIERYILDELKQLRQDQQNMKAELVEKVTTAKLDVSDRAIQYAADTTNNVFYIITIAASLLVLLGWKSLQDIKTNIESITSKQLAELTLEYENRLDEIEAKLKRRTEQITTTNIVHSLWMRTRLEKSELEKISIYDEILELQPENIEALTYKAKTLLDIDEDQWALSLSNQAIEIDDQYAHAYWQRACAKANLNQHDGAVKDIKIAISLTASLKEEIANEPYFENLKDDPEFQILTGETGFNEC